MSSTSWRAEWCATVVFSSLKLPIKQSPMCGIDNQYLGSCVYKKTVLMATKLQ